MDEPTRSPDLHDPADLGPELELDPEVDARIRDLLASSADPGPMPADVSERIEAALVEEARLRVDRGPLSTLSADDRVLAPLIRQRQRRGPIIAAASVAAAAAIVAVGGSALHLNKRGDASAIIGQTPAVTAPVTVTPQPTTSPQAQPGRFHVQLSSREYREETLPEQARALVESPGPALGSQTGDPVTSPEAVGPLGTESGLAACLEAASFAGKDRYVVDLATYEGQPAAVIAGRLGIAETVIVVERDCRAGDAGVLKHTTRVP